MTAADINTPAPANTAPVATVSRAALARATLAAAVIAGAVLVLFVLPAEAGIDPTGAGRALGIAGMGTGTAEPAEDEAEAETAPAATSATATGALTGPDAAAIRAATPWREDTQTITLEPHSDIEVKAHMAQGDSFVFDWKANGGPVKVDMHGEPPNAAEDEFTSYWIEKDAAAQAGTFRAQFAGSHGWYWRNKGDVPVTITLKVAGFYKDLYRP